MIKGILIKLAICGTLIPVVFSSRKSIAIIDETSSIKVEQSAPLYLPKKEAVKAITLGYENFVSQLLWFSTLNYFGEKFISKESMPWFDHQCELVTDLNPRARHVFEFCGTLLSWIAKEPANANTILTKAIKSDPTYWRYYYLRGFNNWYFLEDLRAAKDDFSTASNLPEAPSFLVSLASRLMVKDGEEDNAIAFLKSSYVRTQDLNAKEAIAEKLNLAVIARDVRQFEEGIKKYKLKHGKAPVDLSVLESEGYIPILNNDPFGDSYQYDKEKGEVSSIQGGRGLSFNGKTANSKLLEK